jgi:cobalt ECF transporter T component CbiQ
MPIHSREQEFFELARARRLRPARNGFVDKTLRQLAAFFSDALLREETARRLGLLQRLDPRARLLGTLFFVLSVSLARSIPALAVHAALVAAALWLSRLRLREILGAGLLIALVFSTLMALPATLNLVSGGEPLLPLLVRDAAWRLGPYTIPPIVGISREGVLTAATFLLRTLTSVAAVLCLALSTRWMDLLRALRFLRLPPLVLQTLGMTVRYLHVLLRQSEEIHLGKKSRTLTRRPLIADHMWVGSRIAYAWEKSLRLMEDVGEAMTARGFTGEVRVAPGSRLRAADWGFLAAVAGLCLGAHFA